MIYRFLRLYSEASVPKKERYWLQNLSRISLLLSVILTHITPTMSSGHELANVSYGECCYLQPVSVLSAFNCTNCPNGVCYVDNDTSHSSIECNHLLDINDTYCCPKTEEEPSLEAKIIGGVIGGVVMLTCICCVIIKCYRECNKKLPSYTPPPAVASEPEYVPMIVLVRRN